MVFKNVAEGCHVDITVNMMCRKQVDRATTKDIGTTWTMDCVIAIGTSKETAYL